MRLDVFERARSSDGTDDDVLEFPLPLQLRREDAGADDDGVRRRSSRRLAERSAAAAAVAAAEAIDDRGSPSEEDG